MRRARTRAWSAVVDAEPWARQLVGPWQYQCRGQLGSTRYTTLPGTHLAAPPRVLPTPSAGAVPGLPRGVVPVGHAHMVVLGRSKEILGVNNAHPMHGIAQPPARLT